MAGGTEQTSRVVEAGLTLLPGPILAAGPDAAAAAEPTVAVPGLLAELDVPRGVALGLFAAVVSTLVDDEAGFVVTVPTGPGTAALAFVGLETDPMLVPFAAFLGVVSVPMVAERVLALGDGSMLDEHELRVVLAPEVHSMKSGFECSTRLSVLRAAFAPGGTDVIPKEAGMAIDSHLLPEAELDAMNVVIVAVVFAFVAQPR